MKAHYKVEDIIYSNKNKTVFVTKIKYGEALLKVLEVIKHKDGCSYVVEFVDKNGNMREWHSIPNVEVISPKAMLLTQEQYAKIAEILAKTIMIKSEFN